MGESSVLNIKEHLIERHVNLDLHRPILDNENSSATFLCYNLSGQLCGYQTYSPLGDRRIFNCPNLGRYYTYRNKNQQTVVIWGIESYFISDGPIFITEGIFDAARLTERNQTAFAMLCNSPPKDYKNWLQLLTRPIIAICDNDTAGLELSRFSDYYEIVPSGDLGSAADDYVSYLLSKYA
jgi:hypothetical protein